MKHLVLWLLGLCVTGADAQPHTDLIRAENLYRAKCASCHSVACNRNGPKLEGLWGRKAGTVTDYPHYTQALKDSAIVWSDQTLDDYLRDPGKLVPGTSMVAAGRIDSASERKDILAHVKRQDRRIDLCL